MVVKEIMSLKVEGSIEVTPLPIVTVLNVLQSVKVFLPIEVTPLPIVTEVKELQAAYLQPVITQYFANNKSEIWS